MEVKNFLMSDRERCKMNRVGQAEKRDLIGEQSGGHDAKSFIITSAIDTCYLFDL